MTRALLAAMLCALAAPAAAAAQGAAEREPIVGGGSFLSAPLIESGGYSDTLLPGERLYYGVEVEAGQKLRVAAQLDSGEDKFGDFAAGFGLGVQTPLREVDVIDAVDEDITGNGSITTDPDDRLEYVTKAALPASAAREEGIVYRGPGTWYVSLYLSSQDDEPAQVEFPVRLEVEVQGEPAPDPSPDPTPAEPEPRESEREGESGDGGGTSTAAVIGLGAAGLVVGLAGGAAAGLASRRRRT